jgi:hypothetical protein
MDVADIDATLRAAIRRILPFSLNRWGSVRLPPLTAEQVASTQAESVSHG